MITDQEARNKATAQWLRMLADMVESGDVEAFAMEWNGAAPATCQIKPRNRPGFIPFIVGLTKDRPR